jgi:hypothetical protein
MPDPSLRPRIVHTDRTLPIVSGSHDEVGQQAIEPIMSPVISSSSELVVGRKWQRAISTTPFTNPKKKIHRANGIRTLIGLKYIAIRRTYRTSIP